MENVVFGQNVNGNEVKEENAMNTMENVQENVNVANEEEKAMENRENLVRRFCVECGKEMWVEKNSRVTQCDACKEAKKKATAERANMLAQKRKAEQNLVTMNVTMHEQVKDALKNGAKEKGVSVGEFLRELLNVKIEEVAQEEVSA